MVVRRFIPSRLQGLLHQLPNWTPGTSVEYVVVAGGGDRWCILAMVAQVSAAAVPVDILTGTTPFLVHLVLRLMLERVVLVPVTTSIGRGSVGTNSSAAFPTGTITSTKWWLWWRNGF
jgi:hypothetical protein